MIFAAAVLAWAILLAAAMWAAFELGRRIGVRTLARSPDGLPKGSNAAEAAVFGLLGLLLAFTFSGAASRFEARRHLITEEVNAIGTSYFRIGLLPERHQAEIRALFKQYVDVRAATYQKAGDFAHKQSKVNEALALQKEIWKKSLSASLNESGVPHQSTMLLFSSLNEMIDIVTTRELATRNHPPLVVFGLLAAFILIGAMLVGYDSSLNKRRPRFHTVVFFAAMAISAYVIMDLEFPRLGLIRVDTADQAFMDLKNSL